MTEQPNNPELINEDVSFEESDLNVRGMVIAGAVILLLTVAAMFLIIALIRGMETRTGVAGQTPATLNEGQPTPPSPRLQPNPIDGTTAEDQMSVLAVDQQNLLTTYGWVDKEAGIARIPIDTAILILTPDEGEPPK